MTTSLQELIDGLGGGEMGRETFKCFVEELELLENGEGLLALRAVLAAKVKGGVVTKKLAAISLIRKCKGLLPAAQQTDVIMLMSEGWSELKEEDLLEILRALEQLSLEPYGWDLSSIKLQVARLADSESHGLSLSAKSLRATIR